MLRRLYEWTLQWAGSRYAELALAMISFVESSIFPLPAEVLFVPMCLSRPEKAMRFALIATVTSVLGGIAGWLIGFYFFDLIAQPILQFYGKLQAFEDLKARTSDGAILTLLITSGLAHLPPMKVVTILSGVIGFDLKLFVLSAIVVRGAKFFALAWALARYGEMMVTVMAQRFLWLALGVIATAGLIWLLVR